MYPISKMWYYVGSSFRVKIFYLKIPIEIKNKILKMSQIKTPVYKLDRLSTFSIGLVI